MPESVTPPNIVIVAIDSLRADHLGCYGYAKPTSPCIDALAGESLVFDRAFAAGIPTMPSFTTLYTGLHPYRHGIVSHIGERRLAEHIRLLPELAKEKGYVTVACDNLVVQGEGRGSWFARGYDHYSGFLYKPFGSQSAQLTDRALGFVEQHSGLGSLVGGKVSESDTTTAQPLFLFVHYWDPHTPYGPLPPYDTMHYEPGAGPVELSEVIKLAPEYYEAFLGDMKLAHPDDYAYVVAQYDGEISQIDAQVGRLIRGLQERGAWDNTIFVLLSDHGECFGEGDYYFDHHGLYDAVTRIALMMRLPGQTPGRIGALASNEDILPTLSDLAGLETPQYDLTGRSLLPSLAGAGQVEGLVSESVSSGSLRRDLPPDQTLQVRPSVVSSESTRQASLALRTDGWKLIQPITGDAEGRPLPDFYGRPRCPDPLLFDLRSDPTERRNLSRERPDKMQEMLHALSAWRTDMANATGEPDPIQTQGLSLPYSRFMERLLARSAR